jgi:hypothetical protein
MHVVDNSRPLVKGYQQSAISYQLSAIVWREWNGCGAAASWQAGKDENTPDSPKLIADSR